MRTYRTSEVAAIAGVHPNTVRLYEECRLIPPVERRANGYRLFTDWHVEQLLLARTALRVEILQNGLRRQAVAILKLAAAGDFDGAISAVRSYRANLDEEQTNARKALLAVRQIRESAAESGTRVVYFSRKACAFDLGIRLDQLRNWERNGLLPDTSIDGMRRRYTERDVDFLCVIRSLRCAGFSHASILRMLTALSADPYADPVVLIDTPRADEEIVSACDRLLTSLEESIANAAEMETSLRRMQSRYSN